jgi:hypothetical protein
VPALHDAKAAAVDASVVANERFSRSSAAAWPGRHGGTDGGAMVEVRLLLAYAPAAAVDDDVGSGRKKEHTTTAKTTAMITGCLW